MTKRILVTGATGLVGSRFIELYPDPEELHAPQEIEVDITDTSSLKALFSSYQFEAVIHFAAFTDVSVAEHEHGNKTGDTWIVNVEGTKNIVDALAESSTKCIYLSTDMVFPGTVDNKGPYTETQMPELNEKNLNWYGYTKAVAEQYVREQLPETGYIVRINNPVRSNFEKKLDYLRKLGHLYSIGKLYPLFNDQYIGLSYIDDIARGITSIIKKNITPGTYHISSNDTKSPYEILSYYLTKRFSEANIEGVPMPEESKSHYPQWGGLSSTHSCKVLSLPSRSIYEIVDETLLG
jgi:dTDP-4-dehydrorhamnose reductase